MHSYAAQSNLLCQTDGDQIASGNGQNKSTFVWRIKDIFYRSDQIRDTFLPQSQFLIKFFEAKFTPTLFNKKYHGKHTVHLQDSKKVWILWLSYLTLYGKV